MLEGKKLSYRIEHVKKAAKVIQWGKDNIGTIDPEHPANKKENINYRFNGSLIFNIIEKKVSFSLNDFDEIHQKEITEKMLFLTNSKFWNFVDFKDFKYAKIPFSFVHYYERNGKNESFGDIYTLYSADYSDVFISDSIKLGEIEESNKYFNAAVNEFQNKNYEQAISLFEKAFQTNKRNLNAYYNFATMNFSIENKEKGCEIYKFLKDEGQRDAEKLYNEKCRP